MATKFLEATGRKQALGGLPAGERAFETQLGAFLEGSFQRAYRKGVADVSRLFAVATPEEARPFVDALRPLLEDDAAYAAARRRAVDGARAHLAARAGAFDGLLRP